MLVVTGSTHNAHEDGQTHNDEQTANMIVPQTTAAIARIPLQMAPTLSHERRQAERIQAHRLRPVARSHITMPHTVHRRHVPWQLKALGHTTTCRQYQGTERKRNHAQHRDPGPKNTPREWSLQISLPVFPCLACLACATVGPNFDHLLYHWFIHDSLRDSLSPVLKGLESPRTHRARRAIPPGRHGDSHR